MAGTKIDLRDSRLIGPRPIQWLKYRESKKDFINSLDLDVSENLVYFPYRRGQSDLIEEAYLKNFFPTLKTGSGGLDSYMLSARLLILDCPGTTLNIAMAANVPLVCFWDKDSFPFVEKTLSGEYNLEKSFVHSFAVKYKYYVYVQTYS